MAKIRRYVLVELIEAGALALDAAQRATIRAALRSLQLPWDGRQPCELFQARASLDGNAAIYEITYDSAITPAAAFAAVAAALNMDAQQLLSVIQYTIFGEDTESSRAACAAHLVANAADWEPPAG